MEEEDRNDRGYAEEVVAQDRAGHLALRQPVVVAGAHAYPTGHRVGGNRMRFSGTVRLRPDLEWTTKLPAGDSETFWRIAGWLARRYGYVR